MQNRDSQHALVRTEEASIDPRRSAPQRPVPSPEALPASPWLSRKGIILKVVIVALLPILMGVSAGAPRTPGYRFTVEAGAQAHTVTAWMGGGILGKVEDGIAGSEAAPDDELEYFGLVDRLLQLRRSGGDTSGIEARLVRLRPGVERAIEARVSRALEKAGFSADLGGLRFVLPPVLFRFESPPALLVVSPRDRIEEMATVLLRPDTTLQEAEGLEDRIARQGYSALVTTIGGLGVYPSMVPESSDIRWTLRTVAHEWAHQFFALRPLGWRYALGAERDDRMVAVNETAADIIGKEIGDALYQEYSAETRGALPPSAPEDLQFRTRMREIRMEVDRLLAQGKVDEAERYMEDARRHLEAEGYRIRKLNQAYFAFYGSYSDQISLGGAKGDDVGARLRRLREISATLGDFGWVVSSVGSYDDLLRLTSP